MHEENRHGVLNKCPFLIFCEFYDYVRSNEHNYKIHPFFKDAIAFDEETADPMPNPTWEVFDASQENLFRVSFGTRFVF